MDEQGNRVMYDRLSSYGYNEKRKKDECAYPQKWPRHGWMEGMQTNEKPKGGRAQNKYKVYDYVNYNDDG
jgi:hypothetical protein